MAGKRKSATAVTAVVDLTQDSDGEQETTRKETSVIDSTASPAKVHLSQSDPDVVHVEEPEQDEEELPSLLLATLDSLIVGIRYYNGVAHPGEFVTLVREPNNPYDPNAIRVDNLEGAKIGHIKRQQAIKLAPYLDRHEAGNGDVWMEASISRKGNAYTLPCQIRCYVQADETNLHQIGLERLKALTKATRYVMPLRPHIDANGIITDSASDAVVPSMETKTLDWQTQAKELDKMFDEQVSKQLQGLPEPPRHLDALLKSSLLEHQKQGLAWLLCQETKIQRPFYKAVKEAGRQRWLCEITQASQSEPPKGFRGGILADEMGLGKTLQIICLLLANPPKSSNTDQDKQGKKSKTAKKKQTASSTASKQTTNSVGCTLIVCPVSVMSNWEQQIQTHVKEGQLKIAVYQGASRDNLLPRIRDGSINVLLVSYHTLAAEGTKLFGKQASKREEPGFSLKKKAKLSASRLAAIKSSIFDLRFHRIVLDEAHIIRSDKTSLFRGVSNLDANHKWALTGTPFVNRADDIWSLFAFLGIEPLSTKAVYKRAISRPVQMGQDVGLARLRATMAHVALRRSKASAKLTLVPKKVELVSVAFEENSKQSPHYQLYQAIFGSVRVALKAVLQDGDSRVLKNYSSIIEQLLRLRQTCCSAKLVSVERRTRALQIWKEVQEQSSDVPMLTADQGLKLLEKLKGAFVQENDSSELPECAVCLLEMEESQCVILKTCSHVYCETCISTIASMATSKCPLCRVDFSRQDMVTKSNAVSACTAPEKSISPTYSTIADDDINLSPKICGLLATIQNQLAPEEKGVIFSQFTSFLDLIQDAMCDAGHKVTRLDGSMNTRQRMDAVTRFSSDDEDSPRFILCSLHAAGTGINLTRGNHAFMMDTWWNQAVENQAMDRIHRIGQQRNVSIKRFVMKDSVEERIVAMQEAKSLQAKGSMQKLNPEERRKARLNDLKGLLSL